MSQDGGFVFISPPFTIPRFPIARLTEGYNSYHLGKHSLFLHVENEKLPNPLELVRIGISLLLTFKVVVFVFYIIQLMESNHLHSIPQGYHDNSLFKGERVQAQHPNPICRVPTVLFVCQPVIAAY